MDLNGFFDSPKIGCNLFVELPGDHPTEYFLFASSQRLISFLQLANLVILLPSLVLSTSAC